VSLEFSSYMQVSSHTARDSTENLQAARYNNLAGGLTYHRGKKAGSFVQNMGWKNFNFHDEKSAGSQHEQLDSEGV